MADTKEIGFPPINFQEEDIKTRPVPLHEIPMQSRIDREMAIINYYHARIGKSIDVFWGHQDCVEYLQKLILSGGDGHDKTRAGFKPEVLAALINLANMHEVNYR